MATTIDDVHQLQIRNAENGDFDLNLADETARNQITVQTARLDNLLVQGTPTEGNAELIDIRVGADGTIYPTAGDAVRTQIEDLKNSQYGGLTEEAKQALLACFAKVAWIDEDGQTYYDALENALYPPAELVSISAVYTQSGTIYDTDSLDTLKSDLVVTAHWSNGTTSTVTDYELSGTLAEGTSTITVTYSGKTTTFNVTVAHNQIVYSLYNQTFSKSTEGVDTGIKLLETDRTFTILFDGIQTANANANRLFKCVGTESPRKGVYVGSTSGAGASNTAVQWFTNEQHMAIGRNDSCRIRIMYFHEKDSNSVTFKWKKDAESINTLTLTDTFVAHTGNLLIGETGNNNWVGTLTKFELYDTAIDSTAENSFFGDE